MYQTKLVTVDCLFELCSQVNVCLTNSWATSKQQEQNVQHDLKPN